jgi:hypothetical protein
MEQFPHLKFVQRLVGSPRLFGRGEPNPVSQHHRGNRQAHSRDLGRSAELLQQDWGDSISGREKKGLALLDSETVPIFLKINPEILNAEFDLQAFGIEIISEEEDGFIIGASVDNLRMLEEKINGFINEEYGTGRIADLWQIVEGNREEWKPKHILSDALKEAWPNIDDNTDYNIEVSIAFDKPLGAEPDPSKKGGQTRLEKYKIRQQERDARLMERQTNFETFVKHYGKITSGYVELEDSFGCEVRISGLGLKDLVFNYPYVFEVNELEEIDVVSGSLSELGDNEFEILPPPDDAPIVAIIDSGLMENHRFIAPAVDSANSKSYVIGNASTTDEATGGGHGTRVAGALLYPLGLSRYVAPYELPCFIRNLRILNEDNKLLHRYPAELLKDVISDNEDCCVFNLSVNSIRQHRKRHMSNWAAYLDRASFDGNRLFIISAGNIHPDNIRAYINHGTNYPTFLHEPYCGIANPGQSCFAITVGSINHTRFEDQFWRSLGDERCVSAFSRIGPGIWGTIKPDVVEYGGGLVLSKNGLNLVSQKNDTSPELLRSTLHGGSHNGFDAVGTSFAAPKVTHIIAILKKLYPDENMNLLRALLAQSARLPDNHFLNPSRESMMHLGYGIPSLDRATSNTEHRISFYSTGNIKAEEGHIYALKIPEGMRNPSDEYDILLEVTLGYTSKIRRTRQKLKSYLATWVDWTNSKLGESFENYKAYALKEIEGNETEYDKEARKQFPSIDWKIGTRSDFGAIQGFNRSNNTLQKDWAILKSHQLPEEISFVVRGHRGWDKNKEEVPYALVVTVEMLGQNIPIYESIAVENGIEIET